MTLVPTSDPGLVLRLMITAALGLAWIYSLHTWMNNLRGAAAMVGGLFGFALLGLATWTAQIENRTVRWFVRSLGAIVGVGATAAAAVLIVLLRNGL